MTEATTAQPGTGTTAAAPEKVEGATTETTAAAAAPATTEATTAAEKPAEGADKTPRETIAGSTGEDKAAPVQPDWPADWREKLANGDEKFLNKLKRYNSPLDFGGAYRELEKVKVEPKKELSEGATADEVAAWKKENGLPEKPEDYIAGMELPKGVVLGAADKPIAESFAKAAHARNWDKKTYNDAVAWYFDQQVAIQAQREAMDDEFHQKSEDALRGEWGNEYRKNINAVGNILATLPEEMHIRDGERTEVGGMLLAARLPNGRLLGDHPVFVKWLANHARELNPAATLIPSGGGDPSLTVEGRLNEIRQFRRENPDKYDADKKMQAEELQLLDAKSKLQQRGKAA